MARPRKDQSWLPADPLRIKAWYRALLRAAFPEMQARSADLQHLLEEKGNDIRSSRLTDWKLGRCMPSKGWLLALRQLNEEIEPCERLLDNRPVLSKDRLANFFIALDTVASSREMRLQCLDLIPQLMDPWMPEVDRSGDAAFRWRLPKIGNRVVDVAIALKVNTLDPLSLLDCSLRVADAVLAPHAVAAGMATGTTPERWRPLTMEWGFDVLCAALLVHRLVNREMSYAKGELLSKAASDAAILRKVLLGQIPIGDARRLTAMLKAAEMPFQPHFVLLLIVCAQSIKTFLADHGISLAEVQSLLDRLWSTGEVSRPAGTLRQ